jgi:short-subunit dehydrogenase
MNEQDLRGQVIVITGASSGFGKGAARRFAGLSTSLVLAARRGALLEDLAAECEALGAQAIAVPTDISVQEEVESLTEAAIAHFGRIDVWINNAGVGAIGRFEKIPLDEHAQVIKTNLLGSLYGTYCAYRHFLERGTGTLINIASELGRHTVPYYSSYSAAKHGMVGLDDALRQELMLSRAEDIHVCTVMPTAHDTPFFDHAANHTGHQVQAPTPLHDPEDVVDAIVRLACNPKDKEIVGSDGIVKILMQSIVPSVTERIAAQMMHRQQMEEAPPARESHGAVCAPMAEGTEVSAGRLQDRAA